jgi:hypothetical protein
MVFGENTGSMVYEILWGQSTLSGFCPRFVQVQKFSARGQNTFIRWTEEEVAGEFGCLNGWMLEHFMSWKDAGEFAS